MALSVNINNIVSKLFNREKGKTEFSVSLGNIVFNNVIKNFDGVIIPIFEQDIFLPSEQNKYAAVNVYLNPRTQEIIYDKVLVFDKFQASVDADCLFNLIPLAQFILKESSGSFDIIEINEYSRMGTFALTTNGETGPMGITGPQGFAGLNGPDGKQGVLGPTGSKGLKGLQGFTGQSIPGAIGLQGATGITYTGF